MKKHLYISLLLLIIISPTLLFAANTQQRDSISANTDISIKDIIILNEENTIAIQGQKAEFIVYSITKKIRLKILSEKGINKISEIALPETFDPVYIEHFPKERNYKLAYSEMRCNFFKASFVDANGQKKEINIEKLSKEIKMLRFEDYYYGVFNQCLFSLKDLQVGSEVLIEYNYNVNYNVNFSRLSSFRIFFHNDMDKNDYQLTIKHSKDLLDQFEFYNGGDADSIYIQDKSKVYYWHRSNLKASTHELGARPYLTLPYLVFSVLPYELLYELPGSFEERIMPLYSVYATQRERNHLDIAKSVFQGINNRQFNQIKKFIRINTEDIVNDSLNYQSLMKLQNIMAQDFLFSDDIEYFKKLDDRQPRIGDYITKKTLRDISRYDTYVALLSQLNLGYYTTYLCDNRAGEISKGFCKPMANGDFLFSVVLKNKSVQYIYPKKSRFGYYLNELPFYFENAKTRLVSLDDYRAYEAPMNVVVNQFSARNTSYQNAQGQRALLNRADAKNIYELESGEQKFNHGSEYRVYKKAIGENLRQIQLPNSSIGDNYRRSNISVDVKLDDLTVAFRARVQLSGQYSTLTRGVYLYNDMNKTINPLYHKKIWELNKQIQPKHKSLEQVSEEFPFPAILNVEYKTNQILEANKDTLKLSLQNWFNHIIYKNLDTNNRQLDFYPDFLGQDSYVYFIKFDKNIKLINSSEIDLKNDFGELIISVEQVNPDAIKISSIFNTNQDKIPADKISLVADIYNKIDDLNSSSIMFIVEDK